MRKVKKPWGYYRYLLKKPDFWVKEIFVKPNKRISLQSHRGRDEFWFKIEGEGKAEIENRKVIFAEGVPQVIKCNMTEKHRLGGGNFYLRVIEIAVGKPQEKDIIRYQDDYGRKTKQN